MNPYDWRKTLTKVAARAATSAALVLIASASEYLGSGDVPTRLLLFVPIAHGLLAGANNWLKNREGAVS